MAQLAFRQDLTIYTPENDVVPLIGTADASGVPIIPSFSTDPTHPRPWLKPILDTGSAEANFRDGSATIGQITALLVDKRITPADQKTGLVTNLLADATGDTAMVSIRCLVRQLAPDGVTMETLFDGVISKVSLDTTTYVTYKLLLRDIRERERKARLFTVASSTAIYPMIGPADGYGWRSQWDQATGKTVKVGEPAFPAIKGQRCIYKRYGVLGDGSVSGYVIPQYGDLAAAAARAGEISKVWKTYGALQQTGPGFAGYSLGAPTGYPAVVAEWSTTDSGPWTAIVGPPQYGMQLFGQTAEDLNLFTMGEITKDGVGYTVPTKISFSIPSPIAAPADGATIYVRFRSNKEPTEDVPLYFEGNAGDILKSIYDGGFSPNGLGPGVRYSAAGMAAFALRAPYLMAKVTSATDAEQGAKGWVQPNIYRITGYVPAIRNGVIYPVSGDLPDATVPLVTLDDTVIYAGRADWEHGSDNAVNHVEFKYERDLVPSAFDSLGRIPTQKVSIVRDRISSQNRHGAKTVVYEPVTVRAIVPWTAGGMPSGDTSQETGTLLGLARAEALIRRHANGAQEAWAECRASMVASVQVGDWVIMAASWLPDYVTRKRGINRLMQVTKVEKPEPHLRRFSLSDSGPYAAPMATPTVGTTVGNGDFTVTVNVTAFPGGTTAYQRYRAEVQFAYGEAQPDTASGEWKTAGFLTAAGSVVTPKNPPGLLVWTRVRGVADGFRPSAFTVPVATRMPAQANIRDLTLRVNSYTDATAPGKPHVEWSRLLSAGGVRINYARYADGAAEPTVLGSSFDADASLLLADLPITLNQRERVAVSITPYPGFAAGAVTGAAGQTTRILSAQRRDYPYIEPAVAEELSRTATVGTLTLTPTDPQAQITRYMIRTRSGDLGTWSGYVQDTVAPFGGSVTIVQGESSAVGYQVYALDEDGNERLLAASDVEFSNAPLVGTMMVRTTLKTTGTLASQELWTVESIAPDGTRGTVTLVSVTGSASLASGPSVGVATADGGTGVDFLFNRGAAQGPDGGALFRAAKAGFQTDDDSILIPAQDKDTLGLQVQLLPVASTVPAEAWADLKVTDPTGNVSAATVTITYQGMTGVTVAGSAMATGGTLAATPGTAYRIVMPRGAFGTPTGRLMAAGTKGSLLPDSDMVDVPPQDRDTIMPTFLEVATETATTGTLVITPVDPQARLGTVEFRTLQGGVLAQDWTVVGIAGGVYTQTVPLVAQKTSRIEYRYKATPAAGGAATLIDGGSIPFAIGGRPLPPEVSVASISGDGVLSALVAGDSSTNTVRVAIGLDAPPSQDVLEGVIAPSANQAVSGAIASRQGQFTFPLNLLPGQKYFIVAAGYNTALGGSVRNQASDLTSLDGTWTGLSTSKATVRVTGPLTPGSKTISLPIVLSPQTVLAEVYFREFKADPGAAVNVTRTGARIAQLPASQTIDVAVSSPLNYFLFSVKAIDALNRTGPTQEYATDLDAHTVNLKVQAAAGTTTGPNPPTALSGVPSGAPADDVDLSVVLPASNLPDTLRVKQDGVVVADVAVSVLAGATQHVILADRAPGTYSFQVFGVKAGVQSDTGSPIANVTIAPIVLPTPTIALGAYSIASQGYQVTITPGAGTPAGTSYFLEHQHVNHDGTCTVTTTGAWTDNGTFDLTNFFRSHGNNFINGITENVRVRAVKAGYTSSPVSATAAIAIPNVNGSYCPP